MPSFIFWLQLLANTDFRDDGDGSSWLVPCHQPGSSGEFLGAWFPRFVPKYSSLDCCILGMNQWVGTISVFFSPLHDFSKKFQIVTSAKKLSMRSLKKRWLITTDFFVVIHYNTTSGRISAKVQTPFQSWYIYVWYVLPFVPYDPLKKKYLIPSSSLLQICVWWVD